MYIISIKPKYVELILRGEKTVEVRRGALKFPLGEPVLVYATKPIGQIVGVFTTGRVTSYCREFAQKSLHLIEAAALSEEEYRRYIDGAKAVTAIHLSAVWKLRRPVTIGEMQEHLQNWRPPQSWRECTARENIAFGKVTGGIKEDDLELVTSWVPIV